MRVEGTNLLMIGALSVLVAFGGGVYRIVAGILFAIIGAVANAVPLVEIHR